MKPKGVSVVERHVEKAVLVLFLLVLLGVFVWQFLGSAATVQVGNQEVRPEQAFEVIRREALQKKSQLEATQPHPELPESLPSIVEDFREAWRGMAPAGDLIRPLGMASVRRESELVLEEGEAVVVEADADYALPDVPAPAEPVAAVVGGALDPVAVESRRDAFSVFGLESQPYDVRVVSVQSALDLGSIRAAMTSPGAGVAPVPSAWWEGRSEVVEVTLERQRLRGDGSWGETTVVPTPPGGRTLSAAMTAASAEPSAVRQLLDAERASRRTLRRPAFPPMIAGGPWMTPVQFVERREELEEAPTEDAEVVRLQRRLAQIEAEMGRVERRLEGDDEDGRRRSEGGADLRDVYAQAGPGGRGRGGQGGGRRDPDEARREREAAQRELLEERLTRLEAERDEVAARLRTLGVDPDAGDVPEFAAPEPFSEPVTSVADATVERSTIWSHDFSAEAGETYRYRFRYAMVNPFYGNVLPEGQESLAEELLVESAPSAWSEPVRLLPEVLYFVRSAALEGRSEIGGEARVEVELYRFFYGYWRRAVARLEVGDLVAATLEVPEDLVVFEAPEGGEDGVGRTVGEGWTERPLEEGPLWVSAGAYVLDVVRDLRSAGGNSGVFGVLDGGEVVERSVAADEADAVRRELADSAARGEAEGLGRPGEGAEGRFTEPGGRGEERERGGGRDERSPTERLRDR